MCTTYMYSLKFLVFWRKKLHYTRVWKCICLLHIQDMFFSPVLWLHHLNDNLKTAHLDISYLQRIAKLWGLWLYKKKMNLKRVNCEGIYYKMDWLWNLEKKAFHSFCTVREAFSPIHWNDVPAHQNTQSSAIKPSYVHEWVTVSIKISWTYFVFIYQMQEIYISLASPICFL